MPRIDVAKRRRVMQRSMKLGHCVCDPRRACPCDVFRTDGICPCAGERPDSSDISAIRLTQLVHNAGCASKIAPSDLEAVLSGLPAVNDPAVISGLPTGDDAGVYRLDDNTYLVQTVDVMTPVCDDPHTFGRICAANCLSDIYAMGGVPRTALSVLCFPSETMDGRLMHHMLRGAMEVFAQAGVALIGGHSIKDQEIKLGFAITGTVARERLTERCTAVSGDMLVLTKPLGSGVIGFARQVGRDFGRMEQVLGSMARLNRDAAEAASEVGVSACTDVTGFGLFGHLVAMVRQAALTAEVWAACLPAFDGAIEALRDGVVPGAVERNMEFVGDDLTADGVDESLVHLGFDAQTSGGLLLCVPAGRHDTLLAALAARGVSAATIGRMTEASNGRIIVTNEPDRKTGDPKTADRGTVDRKTADRKTEDRTPQENRSCCDHGAPGAAGSAPANADPAGGSSPGALDAFGSLMRSTAAGGRLDARTKELINFALVLLSRCEPCIAAHLKKARQMGIAQDELDEAAWCAVAMGGAPVRMFYLEALKAHPAGQ